MSRKQIDQVLCSASCAASKIKGIGALLQSCMNGDIEPDDHALYGIGMNLSDLGEEILRYISDIEMMNNKAA